MTGDDALAILRCCLLQRRSLVESPEVSSIEDDSTIRGLLRLIGSILQSFRWLRLQDSVIDSMLLQVVHRYLLQLPSASGPSAKPSTTSTPIARRIVDRPINRSGGPRCQSLPSRRAAQSVILTLVADSPKALNKLARYLCLYLAYQVAPPRYAPMPFVEMTSLICACFSSVNETST
jgi:hypothetical protein